MRWVGHVARMVEERVVYSTLVRNQEGKRTLGDLDVDGWIILGWHLRRWNVVIWTALG